MNLKRKHAAKGRTRSRLKRQFGSSTLDLAMLAAHLENHPNDLGKAVGGIDVSDKDSAPPTMRLLATQFHQDVLDDEDPPESNQENKEAQPSTSAPVAPLPKKVRLFFGTHVPILLKDLFDYTPSSGTEGHGLDIFKSAGLANLQMELELYGLATQELQKDLETEDGTD